MKLHTTIKYYPEEDQVESKVYNVQIMYKVDGVKNFLEKEIDLVNYYKKSKEIFSFKILNKP